MRTLPLLPAVKDILLNLKREQQERAENTDNTIIGSTEIMFVWMKWVNLSAPTP